MKKLNILAALLFISAISTTTRANAGTSNASTTYKPSQVSIETEPTDTLMNILIFPLNKKQEQFLINLNGLIKDKEEIVETQDVKIISQVDNSTIILDSINATVTTNNNEFEAAVKENFKEEHVDRDVYIDDYNIDTLFYGFSNVNKNRISIVNLALSMVGDIHYTWGGKPTSPGWNNWWTSESGLDCSGFVEWTLWTAGITDYYNYYSTASISENAIEISKSELKPGDLGLKFKGGSSDNVTNHVGIYVGKDSNGDDMWVHCTTGDYNTVVKNDYSGFTYYCRYLNQDNSQNIIPVKVEPDNTNE